MQKYIYGVVMLLLISSSALAQGKLDQGDCDFFGPLHFKNGKASVIIKVTFKEFFRSGDEPLFTKLEKEKKLRSSDYFTRCCGGSAISFIPENCSKMCYGVMIQKKMNFDINLAKPGNILYLTCIVYEGEKSFDNFTFFTVNNISLKKQNSN
jgi:hypothetical protein